MDYYYNLRVFSCPAYACVSSYFRSWDVGDTCELDGVSNWSGVAFVTSYREPPTSC